MKKLIILRDAEINGVAYTPSETSVEVDDDSAALLLGCDAAREVAAVAGSRDDTLEALLPSEITVQAGGETITVRPITMGQIPAVLAILKPVIPLLEQGGDWMALAAEFGDEFNRALAVAVGKPVEFVRGLPADEGFDLLLAVAEINADFFARRALPTIISATARINRRAQAMAMAGASSSPR